jgi:hypothetical protein
MSNEHLITKIQQANTQQELDEALRGYPEKIVALYPNLKRNYAFNRALEQKQYLHALYDLKRASRGPRSEDHQDVILALENAADKQILLLEKEAEKTVVA